MRQPTRLLPSAIGRVWLVLAGATFLSWAVGEGSLHGDIAPHIGTAAVVIVAMVKLHLVGMHFMELKRAPRPLRAAFDVYLLGAGTAILVTYFLA